MILVIAPFLAMFAYFLWITAADAYRASENQDTILLVIGLLLITTPFGWMILGYLAWQWFSSEE